MKIAAPYQRGSETSRQAAISLEDVYANQKEQVYAILKKCPMTDREIASVMGMEINSVHARRNSLVLEGRVRDSRQRRKNISGRSAVVWEVGEETEPRRPSRSELERRIEKAIMHIETAGYQEISNFRANLCNILKGDKL
jgi:predicted ArsR family transcriptional regulator